MQTGLGVPEGYGVEYADAVDLARSAGCDFVEVLMDGRGHPDRIDDRLGPPLDAASDLDLVVHLPFTVPIWAPFGPQREGLIRTHERCLDAAAGLGADAAVLHPSAAAMGDAYGDAAVIEGVIESVRELHAYGAADGISLHVENLQSPPFDLDGLTRVLDGTDASLVIDTGHARVTGHDETAVAEFVGSHRERIAHVHLNDTRGAEDEHLPFGAGTYDFETIFRALGDDWPGRLCVEAVVGDLGYLEGGLERLHALLE